MSFLLLIFCQDYASQQAMFSRVGLIVVQYMHREFFLICNLLPMQQTHSIVIIIHRIIPFFFRLAIQVSDASVVRMPLPGCSIETGYLESSNYHLGPGICIYSSYKWTYCSRGFTRSLEFSHRIQGGAQASVWIVLLAGSCHFSIGVSLRFPN